MATIKFCINFFSFFERFQSLWIYNNDHDDVGGNDNDGGLVSTGNQQKKWPWKFWMLLLKFCLNLIVIDWMNDWLT